MSQHAKAGVRGSRAPGLLLVAAGVGLGVVLWLGLTWAVEATNTQAFCISCHEMRDNVFMEYKESIHARNPTGVTATCPDCHVPKPWFAKIAAKIRSVRDLYHHLVGTIATPEKFEARRTALALTVWASMKASDSRECRACHNTAAMDTARQRPHSRVGHAEAARLPLTCVECHRGIAHRRIQLSPPSETYIMR